MNNLFSILFSVDDNDELAKVESEIFEVAKEKGIILQRTEPEREGQGFFEIDSVIAMISDGTVSVGLSVLASAIYERLRNRNKTNQMIKNNVTEEEIEIIDKSNGLKIIIKYKKTSSSSS